MSRIVQCMFSHFPYFFLSTWSLTVLHHTTILAESHSTKRRCQLSSSICCIRWQYPRISRETEADEVYPSYLDNQRSSPLLRLSPELCNMIYSIACNPAVVAIDWLNCKCVIIRSGEALPLTCWQIRSEVLLLVDSYNTLVLGLLKIRRQGSNVTSCQELSSACFFTYIGSFYLT